MNKKIVFTLLLIVSFSSASQELIKYKNRDIDPKSTIKIEGVGYIQDEKVLFLNVKSVNLINEQTQKRELVSSLPMFITERAFFDSFGTNKPKLPKDISSIGDIAKIENTFIWTMPIALALESLDSMSELEQITYSSKPFTGQWIWRRGENCFDNYSFNDSMEFLSAHGNTMYFGIYKIVEQNSNSEFVLEINITERIPGDISCGKDWFQELNNDTATIKLDIELATNVMRIYDNKSKAAALGPFEKL